MTVLGPLREALLLRAVLNRIDGAGGESRVLGPDECAPFVRHLTTLSPHLPLPLRLDFDYIVVRQDQLTRLQAALLAALRDDYRCACANLRFLLFTRARPGGRPPAHAVPEVTARLAALTQEARLVASLPIAPAGGDDRAILVTTFNRPLALVRTLRHLIALNCPVLVVDDGSSPLLAGHNEAACASNGAAYLGLPANRGLSGALTIGLYYLLADRRVQWISYFQDDVDVDPALMDRMRSLEHPTDRPVLTGYDADEHPTERETTVAGISVKMKRSSPAVHLHAHGDYWRGILPIPTEYLGAPRPGWEASLEDWWILNTAPASAAKRGLLVPCVPGLVRTFLWHHADSTWGNPNQPDPPLESQHDDR
jgi:hypothetical protein